MILRQLKNLVDIESEVLEQLKELNDSGILKGGSHLVSGTMVIDGVPSAIGGQIQIY